MDSFRIFEAKYKELFFKIEEDYPEVGFYLYVYEKDECIYDYLQDTLEDCMKFALEEFGVPLNSWKMVRTE